MECRLNFPLSPPGIGTQPSPFDGAIGKYHEGLGCPVFRKRLRVDIHWKRQIHFGHVFSQVIGGHRNANESVLSAAGTTQCLYILEVPRTPATRWAKDVHNRRG